MDLKQHAFTMGFLKEAVKAGLEKEAFLGTSIGALMGALKAQSGQGWRGAGYGALKGLGVDSGAAAGVLPGFLLGGGLGAAAGGVTGAALGSLTGGYALGPIAGGVTGYNVADAALNDIYSPEQLQEIFGDQSTPLVNKKKPIKK